MERLKVKEVATAIAGQAVIVKRIQMPRMTEKELAEAIQWEAEQHIPFSLADVHLDFQILPAAGKAEEGAADTMDVLLVAAKKTKVHEVASVLSEAGLTPAIVDVEVFAIENSFALNYGTSSGVVALVDIGAATMNINILKDGVTLFQRDIAMGGNHYTTALQKEFGISFEQAEQLKRGVGFTPERSPARVLEVMAAVSEDICEELQRSFEFFRTTTAEEGVEKVILSGGCAHLKGLDRFCSERLGLPVDIANPFLNLQYNEKTFDPEYLQEMAPVAAVGVGLALRRIHDR